MLILSSIQYDRLKETQPKLCAFLIGNTKVWNEFPQYRVNYTGGRRGWGGGVQGGRKHLTDVINIYIILISSSERVELPTWQLNT